MATGGRLIAAILSAVAWACLRPTSERCSPGALPGSTLPVVGVCRGEPGARPLKRVVVAGHAGHRTLPPVPNRPTGDSLAALTRRDRVVPALRTSGRLARAGGSNPRVLRTPARSTGAARSLGSVTPKRGSASSDSPLPLTAVTAPAGCSPGIAPVTGSLPRCGARALPISRRASLARTGCTFQERT